MPLSKLATGIYNVEAASVHAVDLLVTSSYHFAVDNAKLWHLRLSRLPFSQIKHVLPDCNVQACMPDVVCQVCPIAKQTRKPFPLSSIKTIKPFEMIHINV